MSAKQKIVLPAAEAKLQLAFDVGHSSIGWAVLKPNDQATSRELSINILGCGAVTYRADDCLASARRAYRRQRRHIRSTRQRIARLKVLLAKLGVLNKTQLDTPGCAWPWLLAARVLAGGKLLTWPELWDVLRWYAHNRGYDGNRRWSAAEADAQAEDSEKEANARTLMGKHGAKSMAETYCKELGLDPKGKAKASTKRFKGLNAAFPREIVEGEVRQILKTHFGKLPKVDPDFERALLGTDNRDKLAWQTIPCPDLKLPNRYQGGLLFGQLVPRFDNRIISTCPISGEKVPSRDCPEFLSFRWAMQLANVQVLRFGEKKLSPLTASERVELDKQMRQHGAMTAEQFKKAVRSTTSAIRDNLDTMLMHPDAHEALLLDPVQKLTQSNDLKAIWPLLPERLQKRTRGQWRRSRSIAFADLRKQLEELGEDTTAFDAELTRQLDATNTKGKKKDKLITREELLKKSFSVKKLGQRAAFARHLLKQAYTEVLAGKHPKEEGGCLFITEEIRQKQMNREIAEQTNNHLVRHRLLILERLLGDMVKEYAANDKERIGKITIEVNRDLREMSGKTAKEKAQDLGLRIANHHAVSTKLEKAFAEEGSRIPITAGLIRKARIADDLGWRCPYTGVEFEPKDLVTRSVDKDHIVPRSERASDSLDSLVVTFSAINKWKSNRTAFQFVEQEQGKSVPDLPNLSIMSLTRYKQLVEGLESYKGHDDDKRRKKRRKDLMLLPKYEEKEFVPRDLTQTSQLVRLGAQVLKRTFAGCKEQPVVVSLPGSVTGTVRKAWKVLGCLSLANPQVLDENGAVKNKTDIRDITHLHHALDACVLGLASHFIPNNGQVWELIVKRNPNELEKKQLVALGVFGFSKENRFEMRDLDDRLKEQIRQRLAEKRVAQHIPSDMTGMDCDQTVWRLFDRSDSSSSARRIERWLKRKDILAPEPNSETALITFRKRREKNAERPKKLLHETTTWWWAYDIVLKSKLVGHSPAPGAMSKLRNQKAVKVLGDNFGIALTDSGGEMVRPFKVWHQLNELKSRCHNQQPKVLRKGTLVRVPKGDFAGVWKIAETKEDKSKGLLVTLCWPDLTKIESKGEGQKRDVRVRSLVRDGMEALGRQLTGVKASHSCPTTSSA